MARPRVEQLHFQIIHDNKTIHRNLGEEASQDPLVTWPKGFIVTEFDVALSELSINHPTDTDDQLVELLRLKYGINMTGPRLQQYRSYLRGESSNPQERSWYEVRELLKEERVDNLRYKVDLQYVIASLLQCGCSIMKVNEILSENSKVFVGTNTVIDLIMMDLYEKYPEDLIEIVTAFSIGVEMPKLLTKQLNPYYATDFYREITKIWLQRFKLRREVFYGSSLEYCMEALQAYAGALTPEDIGRDAKKSKNSTDPRGVANQALAHFSKDLGSRTVSIIMGWDFSGHQVTDLIDRGFDYLLHTANSLPDGSVK